MSGFWGIELILKTSALNPRPGVWSVRVLGIVAQGLGFRDSGLEFRVSEGSRFRVQGVGSRQGCECAGCQRHRRSCLCITCSCLCLSVWGSGKVAADVPSQPGL